MTAYPAGARKGLTMNSRLPMKNRLRVMIATSLLSAATGCQSGQSRIGYTNPSQPGPAIGRATGSIAGGVGGNVVGGLVGIGEGAATAGSLSFRNEKRIVRHWRTERTADGRTIQVPEDIEVDEFGRPIKN